MSPSRRAALGTLVLLAFLAGGYAFMGDDLSPPASHVVGAAHETPPAARAAEPDAAGPAAAAVAPDLVPDSAPDLVADPAARLAPSAAPGEEIADAPARRTPDPRDVLAQARENPHQTPQTLIDFAHELAAPMARAMKSEAAARPVFAQMESCANDRDGTAAMQARVVCLANAARLAELYPSLAPRYRALASQNPSIAAVLETTGL